MQKLLVRVHFNHLKEQPVIVVSWLPEEHSRKFIFIKYNFVKNFSHIIRIMF